MPKRKQRNDRCLTRSRAGFPLCSLRQRAGKIPEPAAREGRAPRGGFTLLEVLIAVAIFAMVLVAINGVFYAAIRLRTKTNEGIDAMLPVERSLTIIRRDLEGLVPPGGILTGAMNSPAASVGSGAESRGSLEFFSGTGVLSEASPFGDIQKVAYYLRTPIDQTSPLGKDLVRTVTRNLLASIQEQPEEQWLMENVQELSFGFYTGTEWRESWESSNEEAGLPEAIRLLIAFAPGEEDKRIRTPVQLVVPILTQVRTNVTQTNGAAQ